MPDIETVRMWTRWVVTFAAIGVTIFPCLYMFSPWYRSPLGRASMLKAVALMVSIDFYAVYQYWAFTSNIYYLVWFRFWMYLLIGLSGYYMTVNLLRYNFNLSKEKNDQQQRDSDTAGSEVDPEQRDVRPHEVRGSDPAAGTRDAVLRPGGAVEPPEAH